jgi:hypothetical protein
MYGAEEMSKCADSKQVRSQVQTINGCGSQVPTSQKG